MRRAIYRDGYFKVSRRLLDSSLWCEDADVVKVFLVLVALSQDPGGPRNGVVYIARRQLAARCFLDESRLSECVGILSREDTESRTQMDGGRRVEILPNGFRVLNYPLYHDREADEKLSAERSRAGRVGGRKSGQVRASQSDKTKQKGSKAEAKRSYGDGEETDREKRTDYRPSAGDSESPKPPAWNSEAIQDHMDGTGGVVNKALAIRITTALRAFTTARAKKLGITPLEAWRTDVRPLWQTWCRGPNAKFGPESFASNPKQAIPPPVPL